MSNVVGTEQAAARAVLDHQQSELEDMFAALPPIPLADVAGTWTGHMAGVIGLERLPRPARGLLHAAMSTRFGPWQGKRFFGTSGANIWGTATRHTDWLEFCTEPLDASPVDGRPVLWLDYDAPANPVLLRAIRGELRLLGPDMVLGRMMWRTSSALHTVMYFPMRRDG